MITPSPTSKSRTRLLLIAGAIAVATLALFAGVFAYTRGDESGSATDAEVQALYDRMLAAMTRDGMVLHTNLATDCGRIEMWIDPVHDTVRTHSYSCDDTSIPYARTISHDGKYWQVTPEGYASSGEPLGTCGGAQRALEYFLLPCSNHEGEVFVLEDAPLDGRTVIELKTSGEYATSEADFDESGGTQRVDLRVEFDDRLYVDPETWLPIAMKRDYRHDGKGAEGTVDSFEHAFVERSSLGADFFEPSGIGYIRDIEREIPRSWFEEFDLDDRLDR